MLIDGQNELGRHELFQGQGLLFSVSFVTWQREQLGGGCLPVVSPGGKDRQTDAPQGAALPL